MPSIMAIVSKAIFEKQARGLELGDVFPTDRYVSSSKALKPLEDGGSLFLVTVRPNPERLWLVAVLDSPSQKGAAWVAKRNTTSIRDITSLLPQIRLASGKGIQASAGALGMSLQTPRILAASDEAILRGKKEAAKKSVAKKSAGKPERAPAETLVSKSKKNATRSPAHPAPAAFFDRGSAMPGKKRPGAVLERYLYTATSLRLKGFVPGSTAYLVYLRERASLWLTCVERDVRVEGADRFTTRFETKPERTPIVDLGPIRTKIRLVSGEGLPATNEELAKRLTRGILHLTAEDVALIRHSIDKQKAAGKTPAEPLSDEERDADLTKALNEDISKLKKEQDWTVEQHDALAARIRKLRSTEAADDYIRQLMRRWQHAWSAAIVSLAQEALGWEDAQNAHERLSMAAFVVALLQDDYVEAKRLLVRFQKIGVTKTKQYLSFNLGPAGAASFKKKYDLFVSGKLEAKRAETLRRGLPSGTLAAADPLELSWLIGGAIRPNRCAGHWAAQVLDDEVWLCGVDGRSWVLDRKSLRPSPFKLERLPKDFEQRLPTVGPDERRTALSKAGERVTDVVRYDRFIRLARYQLLPDNHAYDDQFLLTAESPAEAQRLFSRIAESLDPAEHTVGSHFRALGRVYQWDNPWARHELELHYFDYIERHDLETKAGLTKSSLTNRQQQVRVRLEKLRRKQPFVSVDGVSLELPKPLFALKFR